MLSPNTYYKILSTKSVKIQAVLLSYFHKITGPICIYEYPSDIITSPIKIEIARIMDLAAESTIFTHNSKDITLINNVFEIPSKWARGSKERVMVSILFSENISHEVEQVIQPLLQDFEARLKGVEEIFKGFYNPGEVESSPSNDPTIIQMKTQLKTWIRGLFSVAQSDLYDHWTMKYYTELSILSEDQLLIIQNIIRTEGFQILDFIEHGIKTREDLSKTCAFHPKFLANMIQWLINLDLITEGLEFVLTNRGKKVLHAKIPEYQINEADIYIWEYIIGENCFQILSAIRDGKIHDLNEKPLKNWKKILRLLRQYNFIIEVPHLRLTPYSQKLLEFVEKFNF